MTESLIIFLLGCWLIPGLAWSQPVPPAPDFSAQTTLQNLQATPPENVMIILDTSYSMADKLPSGETRMAAAKRAIMQVVQSLPPNIKVGLRIYGNSSNAFVACQATKKLVPLGTNNRVFLMSQLIQLKPTGSTPISYALRRGIFEDFQNVQGPKTVILVSDGMETCGVDPCEQAIHFMQMGIDVKINVIGFTVKDKEAIQQLKCTALATYGQFYTANTVGDLVQSLNRSFNVETNIQGKILIPPASPRSF